MNHQHSPKHWQWKPFNEINVYQVECTIELHNCFVCIISKPIKKSTWETLKLLYPIAPALYQHYTTMQKYYMPRLSPFLHLAVKQKHKNLLNSHYYNIFCFFFSYLFHWSRFRRGFFPFFCLWFKMYLFVFSLAWSIHVSIPLYIFHVNFSICRQVGKIFFFSYCLLLSPLHRQTAARFIYI